MVNADGSYKKIPDLAGIETIQWQKVRFQEKPEIHLVDPPYSRVYGHHPSAFVFVGPVGSLAMKRVHPMADPFTGRTSNISQRRLREWQPDVSMRVSTLRSALQDGAAWEMQTADCYERFLYAVNPKKKLLRIHDRRHGCHRT